jgi:hypothetical protein
MSVVAICPNTPNKEMHNGERQRKEIFKHYMDTLWKKAKSALQPIFGTGMSFRFK